MTAVPAQTSLPSNPPDATVSPGVTAPSAPASPAGDNAPLNPPQPTASTTETRPGAGLGVKVEEMNAEELNRTIELLDDDGTPSIEQPAAPAAAPAAPAQAPAPAAPAAPVEEEGLTVPGQLPRNMKVPTDDPLAFHTSRFYKEARLGGNKGMTFGQAEKLAKAFLGMEDEAPGASPEGDAPPAAGAAPGQPAAGSLDAQIEAAYATYQEARANFDDAAEVAAMREINRLERERTLAEQRQQTEQEIRQTEEEARFLEEWNASSNAASRLFPDAANPQSELAVRAAEIQAQYRDSNDPALQAIYQSANSPLFFYQQAAAALNVAPVASPAPAPPRPVTPQPVPRQVPPVQALLASNPGTTNPAAPPSFDVNRIQNMHDLESVIDALPNAA